ncbi:MAG TPA: uroporphyrinogen decarboxylase family protein, partial [Ilumatobacteraceae bacterium]|nr:uroporphyrinogen decarboxylase family protein [Ilumatobacteraceae bacterium]
MAFGQQSGPPASAKQIAYLQALLDAAGYTFATARHQYGLTQRQARGKFSVSEASALIDRLVEATSAYLMAQVEAGAEALQIFDTWAGSVPAGLFERAVTGPTARIVAAVKANHPDVPIIGFPRGAGGHLGPYARATGVDGIGVDHMCDIAFAATVVPPNVALQG